MKVRVEVRNIGPQVVGGKAYVYVGDGERWTPLEGTLRQEDTRLPSHQPTCTAQDDLYQNKQSD